MSVVSIYRSQLKLYICTEIPLDRLIEFLFGLFRKQFYFNVVSNVSYSTPTNPCNGVVFKFNKIGHKFTSRLFSVAVSRDNSLLRVCATILTHIFALSMQCKHARRKRYSWPGLSKESFPFGWSLPYHVARLHLPYKSVSSIFIHSSLLLSPNLNIPLLCPTARVSSRLPQLPVWHNVRPYLHSSHLPRR